MCGLASTDSLAITDAQEDGTAQCDSGAFWRIRRFSRVGILTGKQLIAARPWVSILVIVPMEPHRGSISILPLLIQQRCDNSVMTLLSSVMITDLHLTSTGCSFPRAQQLPMSGTVFVCRATGIFSVSSLRMTTSIFWFSHRSFDQLLLSLRQTHLSRFCSSDDYHYAWPGSNWRPSACWADVIATRPREPLNEPCHTNDTMTAAEVSLSDLCHTRLLTPNGLKCSWPRDQRIPEAHQVQMILGTAWHQ